MMHVDPSILKSFKGAFFQAKLKDRTIDIYKMIPEAMKMWDLEYNEAWNYLKVLEKEGFIKIEAPTNFPNRYAWMSGDTTLGSAYY